tara:strand:- start:92 stop:526 length:435 start_codon:yes stop_codon:yes gene_type:complete
MDFSLILTSSKDKLIPLATSYVDFPKYLPDQIKSVIILEQTSSYTITEETLHLSTVISKSFVQQSKHYTLDNDILKSDILSGPAKGTTIKIKFSDIPNGTDVYVNIDLKLGLKYKFLLPLIKKSYKMFLMGILYKMHALAMKSD